MENKENKEKKELEEKKYKSQYEISGAEVKEMPTISVSLSKTINSKTKSNMYSLIAKFNGLDLRDKRFNGDTFLLCLVEHKYKMEDALKINKVTISAPYRPIRGIRKDNGKDFFGLDVLVSNTYRPRIFFTDTQLKILKICNVNLPYVLVESDGTELDWDINSAN